MVNRERWLWLCQFRLPELLPLQLGRAFGGCWDRRGQPEPALVMARTAASFSASSWGNSNSCCTESAWNSVFHAPDWIYYCSFLLTQLFESLVLTRQETPQQHPKASAEADLPLPGDGSRELPDSLHFGLILFLKSQNHWIVWVGRDLQRSSSPGWKPMSLVFLAPYFKLLKGNWKPSSCGKPTHPPL